MKITEPIRQHILKAMHAHGISQTDFAKELGRSKAWVSRLLNPGPQAMKRLDEADAEAIEALLGIMLQTFVDKGSAVPQMALDVAEALSARPDLAAVIAPLLELAEPKVEYAIPNLRNKTLLKLGAEATRIVAEWEEPKDPHFTKIGLEIVVVMREVIEKELRST